MHMADALISPAVGGAMWAAASGLTAYSAKKIQKDLDESKVPLMGVLGAFIFAAQMINFTIPGTGSSGHLGGGMILAILLGPFAGFITMASILIIQALFFADGGILALGSNIFNMGFFPCFVMYPLYQRLVGEQPSRQRLFFGAILVSVIGLQLGAFSVVLETLLSGITELPFGTFVLLMQPIHLAIGIVEGLVTAALIAFVWQERPEILRAAVKENPIGSLPMKRVLTGLLIAAVVTGGALSWFASAHPDGLEWSILHTAGTDELETPDGIHQLLADVQKKIAFLPDYGFPEPETTVAAKQPSESAAWPAVNAGTSVAGLVGAGLTLLLAGIIGKGLHLFGRDRS